MFYQLSHATKCEVIVLTTRVIIAPLGGVVKMLGGFFSEQFFRKRSLPRKGPDGHRPCGALPSLHWSAGRPHRPCGALPTLRWSAARQSPLPQAGPGQPGRPARRPYECSSMGRRTVNVEPCPGALSTATSPPHRSTMRLTSERPRPLPSVAWAVSP